LIDDPRGKRRLASALQPSSCGEGLKQRLSELPASVGPNLDQVSPSRAVVLRQVTDGGGGMPAFCGRLSAKQIDAVATFVAGSARKK
jgi:hypothetical protein